MTITGRTYVLPVLLYIAVTTFTQKTKTLYGVF